MMIYCSCVHRLCNEAPAFQTLTPYFRLADLAKDYCINSYYQGSYGSAC